MSSVRKVSFVRDFINAWKSKEELGDFFWVESKPT